MIDFIVEHFSFGYAVLSVLFSYVIFILVRQTIRSHRIASLGYRAPEYKDRFLGAKFIYDGIEYARRCDNITLWKKMFRATNVDERGTGTFTFETTVLGTQRVIFTVDPENTKTILTSQFTDYGKGEEFHSIWEPFLGDSIFATDGHKWQFARNLLRPMFARERVVDVDLFEHHMQKLLPMLGSGNGSKVDVLDCFYRYTIDAATHFLLGSSVGSMDEEKNDFAEWFSQIQRMEVKMIRAGPLHRYIPRGNFNQNIRNLNAFLDPIISQALALSPKDLDHSLNKEDTFLHQLARATRDRKVIRDQLVAILLAGRDTTACTLSWTIYELARHPEVQKKLCKEIKEHVGERAPTYQDIKDMKYMTWVLNETLRRYPVVPINVRYSLTDTTLPHGGGADGSKPIGVLNGTAIVYSPLIMQRRPELYPPLSDTFPYDPDEWAPDRWATWTPKSWHYIPFNGGPRICIGQQFALVEMGYTICRIFQHFDYVADLGDGDQEKLLADVVLSPGDGIKVGFYKTDKEWST